MTRRITVTPVPVPVPVRVSACLLAAALAACGTEADDTGPPETPPAAGPADTWGGHDVGVTTLTLVDPSRDDRRLVTDVWYPATLPLPFEPTAYELVAGGLPLARLPSPNRSSRDAPPDRRGAPYPVVLFSHGNGGVRFQSAFLTEWLASHGYVVLSPDHAGNTFDDLASQRVDALSAKNRPRDLTFVLDAVAATPRDDPSGLAGLLDVGRVGATGHSFGGYTANVLGGATLDLDAVRAACVGQEDTAPCRDVATYPPEQARASFADARVKAVAPMAPGFFDLLGAAGIADIGVPVLVEGGDVDRTTPWEEEQQPVFDATSGPRYRLQLAGAGHFTFSDICRLLDVLSPALLEALPFDLRDDGCGEQNIPFERAQRIIGTFTQAFFDRHLRGDPAADAFLGPVAGAADTAVRWTAEPDHGE